MEIIYYIAICLVIIGIAVLIRITLDFRESLAKIIAERLPMTINGYQQMALRTESPTTNETDRILQGAMGLCGESGEYIDILKKYMFQGHELDKKHMAKELGDIAWYLAVSADAIDYDLETIFQMNIDKLKARYPEGFETNKSTHRKADDI